MRRSTARALLDGAQNLTLLHGLAIALVQENETEAAVPIIERALEALEAAEEAEVKDRVPLKAELVHHLGLACAGCGRRAEAGAQYAKLVAHQQEHYGAVHPMYAAALVLQGTHFLYDGQRQLARGLLVSALIIQRETLGEDSGAVQETLALLRGVDPGAC